MDPLAGRLLAQPPMEADRERRLALAVRAGDRTARADLVSGSLRLVALRACSLGLRDDALDDAIQDGTVGLMVAIDRFDPDRGCRLATYAWPWITAAMRRRRHPERPSDQLDDAPDPRVVEPRDDLDVLLSALPVDLALLLRFRYRLGEIDGAPRSRREVASHLGLTPAQVREAEVRAMHHLRRRLAKVCDRAPRRGADPP